MENGEEQPQPPPAGSSRPRRSLAEIRALPPGTFLDGRVRLATPEGFIINVRADYDGFLHENELGDWGPRSGHQITRGTMIRARVLRCRPGQQELKLTLRDGGSLLRARLKPDDLEVTDVVNRILP